MRLQDGAFDRLYRQHRDAVYGYLLVRTRDWALAQDLTSETFLRAYRSFADYTDQGKPVLAWLTTIARNLVLDHLRSSRIRHEIPIDWDALADTWLAPDQPEADVLRRDLRLRLHQAMLRMPCRQAQCLFLRFMVGLSVEQTARDLQLNAPATRALQHRAVRKIGELLTEPDHLARAA
jgi:RNA polymerase sigma-70 factor (ECF subfamily)